MVSCKLLVACLLKKLPSDWYDIKKLHFRIALLSFTHLHSSSDSISRGAAMFVWNCCQAKDPPMFQRRSQCGWHHRRRLMCINWLYPLPSTAKLLRDSSSFSCFCFHQPTKGGCDSCLNSSKEALKQYIYVKDYWLLKILDVGQICQWAVRQMVSSKSNHNQSTKTGQADR